MKTLLLVVLVVLLINIVVTLRLWWTIATLRGEISGLHESFLLVTKGAIDLGGGVKNYIKSRFGS